MIRQYVDKQYKQGTKLKDNNTNKIYVVVSCIDLNWLTKGEKSGYMAVLKEVQQWT